MFERERKLYQIMLGYCKMLTNDVDDAKLADLPAAGLNHPAWILTHLAICTDYAAQLLGEPVKCPKEWHQKLRSGFELVARAKLLCKQTRPPGGARSRASAR